MGVERAAGEAQEMNRDRFMHRPLGHLTRCSISLALLFLALWSSASGSDVQNGNFGAQLPGARQRNADKSSEKASATAKRSNYPFSGEIESYDAKTLVLKGKRKSRILLLTPETRIFRSGSKARLQDAIAGERVSGSCRKNAEGKEEAATIQLKGPKDGAAAAK
jgi:hypothetical protein